MKRIYNSNHFLEYQIQKSYAENILKTRWLLSIENWSEFFINYKKYRDYPPVTTGYCLTRIDKDGVFELGNLRCSHFPETANHLYKDVYRRNVKGVYKPWWTSTKH